MDKDTKNTILSKLYNYFQDNYADDELKMLEWLENYIMELETEIEINITLAEQERPIIEKIRE
jgi:hypothetical protein